MLCVNFHTTVFLYLRSFFCDLLQQLGVNSQRAAEGLIRAEVGAPVSTPTVGAADRIVLILSLFNVRLNNIEFDPGSCGFSKEKTQQLREERIARSRNDPRREITLQQQQIVTTAEKTTQQNTELSRNAFKKSKWRKGDVKLEARHVIFISGS